MRDRNRSEDRLGRGKEVSDAVLNRQISQYIFPSLEEGLASIYIIDEDLSVKETVSLSDDLFGTQYEALKGQKLYEIL